MMFLLFFVSLSNNMKEEKLTHNYMLCKQKSYRRLELKFLFIIMHEKYLHILFFLFNQS